MYGMSRIWGLPISHTHIIIIICLLSSENRVYIYAGAVSVWINFYPCDYFHDNVSENVTAQAPLRHLHCSENKYLVI